MFSADFYMPTRLIFGDDALERGAEFIAAAGKHALLVTGRTSAKKSGALDAVITLLDTLGIKHTVNDGVTENPPLYDCHAAGKMAREAGVDFVIGIGGGSPLDAAKAIAVFAPNDIAPEAVFEDAANRAQALPIFAVPTTAGTGSEANNYSILTLPGGLQKRTVKAPDTWPRASFIVPRFGATMSNAVTISTALDAFAHAMESYLSPRSTVYSEAASLFAAREIFDVISELPGSYDATMRERLSLAATVAGIAISITGTGFPHPLGYSLTLLDGIPHGRACAAFAGDFITYNQKCEKGRERIEEFAKKIGTTPRILAAFLPGVADVSLSMSETEIAEHIDLIAGAKNYTNCPYVLSKEEIFDIYRSHFGVK